MNHRDWSAPSEEHQPVTYWRGHPIYASHFIVIVYCALMILVAVGGHAVMTPIIEWLRFDSQLVFSGQVWRIFSYGLFNYPSLSFAFDMLMIVWFGRELERTFGRTVFARLYAGIYLVPTVVLSGIGLLAPTQAMGEPGALALFVAFATQFPGMPIFFTLIAQWAAVILVGISALMAIMDRNWQSLIFLVSTCGFAHLFVRYEKGTLSLPRLKFRRSQPKLRVLPDLAPKKTVITVAPTPKPNATMAEVDALLDKIAKSGIGSLTAKERAKLESAREGLMKRRG